MAKCDLKIHIEQPGRTRQIGDRIRGRLEISVSEEVKLNALDIRVEYWTHGKGNRVVVPVDTHNFLQNETLGVGTRTFPFDLKVDDGPLTYHGKIIDVDWRVAARADVPWAIDPKAETEFTVGPPDEVTERVATPHELASEQQLRGYAGYFKGGCMLTGGLLAVTLSSFFWVPALLRLAEHGGAVSALSADVVFPSVVSGIIALAGLVIGGLGLKSLLGRGVFQNIDVTLTPQNPFAGETVDVTLAFTPRRDMELNKVTGTLVGQEVAVSGSGTNRSTHRREVGRQPFTIADARSLNAGVPVTLRGRCPLSDVAAPSFRLRDNALNWRIDIDIDIARWPDHKETRLLIVSGGQADAALAGLLSR